MERVTISIVSDGGIRASETIADLRNASEVLFFPMKLVGFLGPPGGDAPVPAGGAPPAVPTHAAGNRPCENRLRDRAAERARRKPGADLSPRGPGNISVLTERTHARNASAILCDGTSEDGYVGIEKSSAFDGPIRGLPRAGAADTSGCTRPQRHRRDRRRKKLHVCAACRVQRPIRRRARDPGRGEGRPCWTHRAQLRRVRRSLLRNHQGGRRRVHDQLRIPRARDSPPAKQQRLADSRRPRERARNGAARQGRGPQRRAFHRDRGLRR